RDAQQRLVREADRALGHSEDLAAEAQAAEMVQEGRVVVADLSQKGQVFIAVSEVADELESHFEASGEQIRATEWRAAGVQVECGQRSAARAPRDVGRVWMVEVG